MALTTTADGKWFIVPPAAMVTADNVNYRTQGLTFVPADDWIQLEQQQTAAALPGAAAGRGKRGNATARRDRRSRHHGYRALPTNPVGCGQHAPKHYTTDEDSSGIALNVQAGLTDTGRLRDPELPGSNGRPARAR